MVPPCIGAHASRMAAPNWHTTCYTSKIADLSAGPRRISESQLAVPCNTRDLVVWYTHRQGFLLASSQNGGFRFSIHRREPYGRVTIMSIGRLAGLLLLIVWLGAPLSAETTAPAVSCSSVFVESLQEYRTTCSNGNYYTTRYRPRFRDWEMRQMFPSGPRQPIPLYRQPRPGARQG
jgi:hypothetical protein